MELCRFVGCSWSPTTDHPVCPVHLCEGAKLHEFGFHYYSACFWHQNCEPSSVYVSLIPGKAGKAAEEASDWERDACSDACGDEDCDGLCDLCAPVLCWSGEHTANVKDLFTGRELLEHRRELLAGGVVSLCR